MYFKEGMTVRVNKDITRTDGWEFQVGEDGIPRSIPNIITYAKEGEIGIVKEIFTPPNYSHWKPPLSCKSFD